MIANHRDCQNDVVIVTGAASGLGKEITKSLMYYSIKTLPLDIKDSSVVFYNDSAFPKKLDMFNEYNILGIINCAGVNNNEWFEDITLRSFNDLMLNNAYSLVAMTQLYLEELKKTKGFVLNIVSNAASIPMTASLAYNASKAAALMITKQMAHELTPKYGITVFSISPNKLKGTDMSKQIEENVQSVRGWNKEYAQEYQRKSLMHGLESPPAKVADMIVDLLLSGAWKYMSGCDIPFGK